MPWNDLHPEGNVSSLEEALSPEFDEFYEFQQTRVEFDYCWNGYVPEAEGPMWEKDDFFFLEMEFHGIRGLDCDYNRCAVPRD